MICIRERMKVMGKIWDEMKKEYKKEKERLAEKEDNKPVKPQLSETEKLAKQTNFLIKGCAFWFLIPVFGIIAIALVFGVFWVWDLITG